MRADDAMGSAPVITRHTLAQTGRQVVDDDQLSFTFAGA